MTESKAKPKDGANTLMELHPLALQAISEHEFTVQLSKFKLRSYEMNCYFLCFKPYNKTYDSNLNWYNTKALDATRKLIQRFGAKAYLITKEIFASKTHFNAIVYSEQDLVGLFNEKNRLNKFRCYAHRLAGPTDRHKVINYITKERKLRSFKLYSDYLLQL